MAPFIKAMLSQIKHSSFIAEVSQVMVKQFSVLIMFLLAGMASARSHMPDFLFERENEIENNGVPKIVAHPPLDLLGDLSCQVEMKEVKLVKGKCIKEGCDTGLYYYPFHQDCMFKR